MQGQKVWGETILSAQYLEKYWGECPIAPMESAPMIFIRRILYIIKHS